MTTVNSKIKVKNDDKPLNRIYLAFMLMVFATQFTGLLRGFSETPEDARLRCISSTRDKVMTEMQESGNTTINSVSEINAIGHRFDHCN